MEVQTLEQKRYVATGPEMAEMLGVSHRRLQQMISEELILGKIGRNSYDISRVIVSFREYLLRKAR